MGGRRSHHVSGSKRGVARSPRLTIRSAALPILAVAFVLVAGVGVADAHPGKAYYPRVFSDHSQTFKFANVTAVPNFDARVSEAIRTWNAAGSPLVWTDGGRAPWDEDYGVLSREVATAVAPAAGEGCATWPAGKNRIFTMDSGPTDDQPIWYGSVVKCFDPSDPTVITSAHMFIDPHHDWYTGTGETPSGRNDLRGAATHEAGHMTGMTGHFPTGDALACLSPINTMCDGAGRTPHSDDRSLEAHDKHTYLEAYAPPPCPIGPCRP